MFEGERFKLDSQGRVRMPSIAVKSGKNKLRFADREQIYECEDFIKLGGACMPSLSEEVSDLVYLMKRSEEQEAMTAQLSERISSLEKMSCGHEIIKTKE